MLSFDTNIAVYAANRASALHEPAYEFITSLGSRRDVAVCELMLVELYLKLRNEKIFAKPLGAAQAVALCETYRRNTGWMLIDGAPIMEEVWRASAARGFAFRRIIDARLAFTLSHEGVTQFATTNVRDFQGFGFERVWNPLVA